MAGSGSSQVAQVALGVGVWVAGLHVFDAVHCVLHAMLRSRFRALRLLAAPHAIHHRWLDERLRIHPELRTANFLGHILPEFATQVVFTAVLATLLPATTIGVALALQAAVFVGVASCRGLDPNHRPVELLDAGRPSLLALPAYHALHHVHPDAHYSAYSKLVDWVVGSGTMLRGRRFVVDGAESPFGGALAAALEGEGAASVERPGAGEVVRAGRLASADVLVLARPDAPIEEAVERFVEATSRRLLPPEVWVVRTDARDPLARHYHGDVRVEFRVVVVPADRLREPAAAARAARVALRGIRRGWNFVPVESMSATLRSLIAFRGTKPAPPFGAALIPHRADSTALRGSLGSRRAG